MSKIAKNIITGVFMATFVGVLFWQYQENPKVAEVQAGTTIFETVYKGMTCDEPIPLGETTGRTQELIKSVQGYYDQTRVLLDNSIQEMTAIVGALTENQEELCDFTKCKADVTDKGLDAALELETFVTGSISLEAHAANCQPELANGEPCPDITELAIKLQQDKEGLAMLHKQVKAIFTEENRPLPDDLKKPGDDKFQKITLAELIRRNADLSDAWLTPPGRLSEQKTCALTLDEQRKVAKGEMADVTPIKCREALKNGSYWPKASSPFCNTACKDGLTRGCRDCLAVDPGDHGSVLAKVNYKIFGVCKDKCDGKITSECKQCICLKTDGTRMADEECLDLLCGERENYICCHQNTLEISSYLADESDFELPSTFAPKEARTINNMHITAYVPPEFPQGQLTKTGKPVGFGDMAINRADMPLGSWIKITSLINQNPGPLFGKPNSWYISDKDVVFNNEDNSWFCASDIGGGIHAGELDLWLPMKEGMSGGTAFGNQTATIEWYYHPDDLCYKKRKNDTSASAFNIMPTSLALGSGGYGSQSIAGILMQAGVEKQYSLASEPLKGLLTHLSNATINGESLAGKWSVSAITSKHIGNDQGLINKCNNPDTFTDVCGHTSYKSCHFGGGAGFENAKSYAFDMSAKYPENNMASAVALAACAWGKEKGVQVTAILESTPTLHYHISVDNVNAKCDANGQRRDNICK